MQRLAPLFSVYLAIGFGLSAVGPSFADDAKLATPEAAVAAYIDGVARQDFAAILAVTSVDDMSKGFDFVAQVGRLRTLTPMMPAPARGPLFVDTNKAGFVAQIAGQVRFLAYGLMTTSEILDGNTVMMDAAGASEFAAVVRGDRLAGLALVKVVIPSPATMNSNAYQANAAKLAKAYGANAETERLALLSFEGLNFVIGFTLLRYGDDWTIMSQSSPLGNTSSWGVPKRVTQEVFESMLR